MSKLEELIEELCPDGVEYKRVDEIFNISRGKVMSKDYIKDNAGDYPVYSSQTENNGVLGLFSTYEYDGEYLTWTTDGANAGTVFYRTGKFSVTNVCGLLEVINTELLNAKYGYYVLNMIAPDYVNRGMGNPKLMSNVMGRIKLPIPPLPVQEEIVRILDNFTNLTAKLQSELQSELQARAKQYEYYRDTLLTFGDDVPRVKIKDVYKRIKGTPITAGKMKEIANEDGDVRIFAGGKTVVNAFEQDIPNANITKVPAMLVQSRGVIDFVYYDKPFTFKNEMWAYTSDNIVSIKYLRYVLQNNSQYFRDAASGMGSLPQISLKVTEEYEIPYPSIEEQTKIVEILEKFDGICADVNCGLPAEIDARQKQYEYYRNKLLSFKEKVG